MAGEKRPLAERNILIARHQYIHPPVPQGTTYFKLKLI